MSWRAAGALLPAVRLTVTHVTHLGGTHVPHAWYSGVTPRESPAPAPKEHTMFATSTPVAQYAMEREILVQLSRLVTQAQDAAERLTRATNTTETVYFAQRTAELNAQIMVLRRVIENSGLEQRSPGLFQDALAGDEETVSHVTTTRMAKAYAEEQAQQD